MMLYRGPSPRALNNTFLVSIVPISAVITLVKVPKRSGLQFRYCFVANARVRLLAADCKKRVEFLSAVSGRWRAALSVASCRAITTHVRPNARLPRPEPGLRGRDTTEVVLVLRDTRLRTMPLCDTSWPTARYGTGSRRLVIQFGLLTLRSDSMCR